MQSTTKHQFQKRFAFENAFEDAYLLIKIINNMGVPRGSKFQTDKISWNRAMKCKDCRSTLPRRKPVGCFTIFCHIMNKTYGNLRVLSEKLGRYIGGKILQHY